MVQKFFFAVFQADGVHNGFALNTFSSPGRYCSRARPHGFQVVLAASLKTVHDFAGGYCTRARRRARRPHPRNPLAILVVDAHDRVQMVTGVRGPFAYRESELVGLPMFQAFIVTTERTAEAAGLSQRGFEGKSTRSVTQRRRKYGSMVDIDLTVVPLVMQKRGRRLSAT